MVNQVLVSVCGTFDYRLLVGGWLGYCAELTHTRTDWAGGQKTNMGDCFLFFVFFTMVFENDIYRN